MEDLHGTMEQWKTYMEQWNIRKQWKTYMEQWNNGRLTWNNGTMEHKKTMEDLHGTMEQWNNGRLTCGNRQTSNKGTQQHYFKTKLLRRHQHKLHTKITSETAAYLHYNRTDTNKTSPTQHIHKTLDKTPHTSNPQTHATNSTPQNYTKQQMKGRRITPIIIGNLKPQTDLNITKQQLQHAFPGKTFTVRQLKKGGIVISPEKQEDVNAFLKHDKYNPQYFGQHLYIHFPHSDSDQRPWLCINKVPLTHNINDIKSHLTNIDQNIQREGLHRKQSSTIPTTLVLFKTNNGHSQNLLIHNTVQLNNSTYTITKYIPKTQTRCTNCQRIGHLKHQCKHQRRCVRCAGTSCIPHNCKSATRKCSNCGQNHSSSYKNRTVLKKHTENNFHIKRQNTYT